jgi:hypothetical protein
LLTELNYSLPSCAILCKILEMADVETPNNRATSGKEIPSSSTTIAPLSLNTPLESWSPSLLQDPPGASQGFDDPLGFWNTRSYLTVNQFSQ